MRVKSQILDETGVSRALMRISHEIIEKNKGTENLCLVGVKRRGEPLAKIIQKNIFAIENADVPCGVVDITFYRDDLSRVADSPVLNENTLPFSVEGKKVVIVDDVLYTGRTVRAAIDAVISLGRPSCIQLAILVDRGHRELPIRGDYIGKNIPTSHEERVYVHLPETDGECGVYIAKQ